MFTLNQTNQDFFDIDWFDIYICLYRVWHKSFVVFHPHKGNKGDVFDAQQCA